MLAEERKIMLVKINDLELLTGDILSRLKEGNTEGAMTLLLDMNERLGKLIERDLSESEREPYD